MPLQNNLNIGCSFRSTLAGMPWCRDRKHYMMGSRGRLCVKKDVLLSAKKNPPNCGFQHCFAFPLLCCFPAERNPISPLHSIWSELILPAAPHMRLPRDSSKGKGQKQKGALKMGLLRLRCQHVDLSSREQVGRQEEKLSQSFLKPDLQGYSETE